MRGYYHVYAHGAGKLCDTRYWRLYLLASRHDKVAELVYHDHDIRHVLMAVGKPQLVMNELVVVFVYLLHVGQFEHVVAVIHELAQRVERSHHLLHVGDDRLVLILRQRGHIVGGYLVVDAELHLLWVHEYELQLVWMLLV